MTDSDNAPTPERNPWKVWVIVLAIILGLAIVAAIIWAVTTARPAPTPTPTATPSNSASPSPSSTPEPTGATGACTFDNLAVTLGEPEGTAGSSVIPLIFTNAGDDPCVVEGYPTVAFVGQGNGTQIGSAATDDTTSAVAEVTLAPGEAATANLTVTFAGNLDDCSPTDPDGFRVYPPNLSEAVFLPDTSLQACANSSASILKVTALAG